MGFRANICIPEPPLEIKSVSPPLSFTGGRCRGNMIVTDFEIKSGGIEECLREVQSKVSWDDTSYPRVVSAYIMWECDGVVIAQITKDDIKYISYFDGEPTYYNDPSGGHSYCYGCAEPRG